MSEGDVLVKKYEKSPYLVTSEKVTGEAHVRVLARFQKYVDNSISKTVNLKQNTTKKEIKRLILLAYELGCKGLTLYRNKSRKEQVICTECD
jgi:ribonucleoside-diphosphate reductase alpha chain